MGTETVVLVGHSLRLQHWTDFLQQQGWRTEQLLHAPSDCAALTYCAGLILQISSADAWQTFRQLSRDLWAQRIMAPMFLLVEAGELQQAATGFAYQLAGVFAMSEACLQHAKDISQAITQWAPLRRCAEAARNFAETCERLSPRERLILDRIVEGDWIKRIAAELGTSPHTVRNQCASLLTKFQQPSLDALLRLACTARTFDLWWNTLACGARIFPLNPSSNL